jgi:hypothetical protein
MDLDIKSQFKKVHERFDKFMDFLREYMPTREEINARFDNVPTKDDFSRLVISIDAYAKLAKDFFQEVKVLQEKVTQMEKWIMAAAAKLGVEYKP